MGKDIKRFDIRKGSFMELLVKEYRGTKDEPTATLDLSHFGHIAVACENGEILWKAGDPARITFVRSAAKPIQALSVLKSGAADEYGITDEELAVMCSSHRGEKCHVEAVLSVLKKAGLDERHLQCGGDDGRFAGAGYFGCWFGEKDGALKTVLTHNCSGKHAGMLLTAKKSGNTLNDYYIKEHPIQREIVKTIAEVCDFPAGGIVTGTDGCGVPVHALPLYKFAQGYARMSNPVSLGRSYESYAARIVSAMTKYPHMVGGHDKHSDFTTELMQEFGDRLFCKFGANGFFAIGVKNKGIGICLKMEDGFEKTIPVAVIETLRQVGELTSGDVKSAENLKSVKSCMEINDSTGNTVGRRVADFVLKSC